MFDGNDSRDDDGYILSYAWDFGDGDTWPTINNSVVNHSYNSAGIYVVNLTVIDNDGATDSYTMEVTIRAEDETIEMTTILLERFGINNQLVETFNVSLFAVSLWGNLTLIGHGAEGEATLEVTLLNPDGILIFSESKNTTIQQAQVNVEFYFDNPLTIIPGEYEMTATCLKGALFLDYIIEIRY
jgi:PKD repeat protein